MGKLLCLFLLMNTTNIIGQCSVNFTVQPNYCGLCNGAIFSNPTGVPAFTYSWSPGGQTTQNITGLCSGLYTLTVTDGSACTVTSVVPVSGYGPSTFTT